MLVDDPRFCTRDAVVGCDTTMSVSVYCLCVLFVCTVCLFCTVTAPTTLSCRTSTADCARLSIFVTVFCLPHVALFGHCSHDVHSSHILLITRRSLICHFVLGLPHLINWSVTRGKSGSCFRAGKLISLRSYHVCLSYYIMSLIE